MHTERERQLSPERSAAFYGLLRGVLDDVRPGQKGRHFRTELDINGQKRLVLIQPSLVVPKEQRLNEYERDGYIDVQVGFSEPDTDSAISDVPSDLYITLNPMGELKGARLRTRIKDEGLTGGKSYDLLEPDYAELRAKVNPEQILVQVEGEMMDRMRGLPEASELEKVKLQ